jgi:hypothetical protein
VDQQLLQIMQLFFLRCLLFVFVACSRFTRKPSQLTVGCGREEGVEELQMCRCLAFLWNKIFCEKLKKSSFDRD